MITSQFSGVSEFVPDSMQSCGQNRRKWTNLARMCEHYQISNRAAAAIANSVLQDVGLITDHDKNYAIDRNELQREWEKYQNKIREEQNFKYVDEVYFSGRKGCNTNCFAGTKQKTI